MKDMFDRASPRGGGAAEGYDAETPAAVADGASAADAGPGAGGDAA